MPANVSAMPSSTDSSIQPLPLHLWHQRLGHLNYQMVRTLGNTILDCNILRDQTQDHHFCIPCLEKRRRRYNKGPSTRAKEFLELIHSDLCGPFPINSITGSRYFMIFVDDKTRYTWVYFLKTKDHSVALQTFKDFKTLIEKQSGCQIKRFRCDNGKGEYDNQYFKGYLTQEGISYEPSAPYTQNQNGVSERKICTISNITRSLLADAGLSEGFWEELVRTAVYLNNRSPTRALPCGVTPYEARFGSKPSLSHLRRIGSEAIVQIHPNLHNRTQTKLLYCTFLGYVENTTKQYRVWHREGHRLLIVASQNVDIDEDSSFDKKIPQLQTTSSSENTAEKQSVLDYLQALINPDVKLDNLGKPINPDHKLGNSGNKLDNQSLGDLSPNSSKHQEASTTVEPLLQVDTQFQPESLPEAQMPVRRSARERIPLPQSFKLRSALSTRVLNSGEPASYNDALKHQYAVQWKNSIKEEIDSLDLNKTWDLIDEDTFLRSGKRAIGSKWVFKQKRNADGSKRFKARLVIKGYEQKHGIDYEETFAPVAKFVTVRLLFALAAQYNWEIDQMDVITAFLNPTLYEEVFMELPEGFSNTSASGGKQYCRLNKSLYGLKQAPRAWYKDIDAFLTGSLGLTRSKEDSNLYYKANIILLLWVDDILLFSPDKRAIHSMKAKLSAKYRMLDLRPVHQFLGIQIERDRQKCTLRIHQKPYIEAILKRFQMDNCNGVSTPMEANLQLDPASDTYKASLANQIDYQRAIGSIMYAMLGTRPDLAFAVSTLSQHCINPNSQHAQAVQRVLRYLKKTLDYGITYGGIPNPAIKEAINQDKALHKLLKKDLTGITAFGFTDSDWAGDKSTRRSTSGYLYNLYEGAISWKSAKQPIVATSSTEAEYIACTEAAKEGLWLQRIMAEICGETAPRTMDYSHESEIHDLIQTLDLNSNSNSSNTNHQIHKPQIIFADNQGAIKLSKNPQHHNRTKHIDVKYHFVRESTQRGLIYLAYIPTGEMVADILTKSLPRDRHEKHMKSMGITGSVGNN